MDFNTLALSWGLLLPLYPASLYREAAWLQSQCNAWKRAQPTISTSNCLPIVEINFHSPAKEQISFDILRPNTRQGSSIADLTIFSMVHRKMKVEKNLNSLDLKQWLHVTDDAFFRHITGGVQINLDLEVSCRQGSMTHITTIFRTSHKP